MSEFPEAMIAQLAEVSQRRYHTAMLEGVSERQAFEEIIEIILEAYREALAS